MSSESATAVATNETTLSTVDLARMLGKSRQTIRQWCETGKIAAIQDPVTGCYRIPISATKPFADRGLIRAPRALRRLMTIPEVARVLGMTTGHVTMLVAQRRIAHVRLDGGSIRIEDRALDAFIDAATIPAITPGSI